MADEQALHGGLTSLDTRLPALAARTLDRPARRALAALQQVVDSLGRAMRGVGDELAGLETAVESADREPTEQVRDVFAELRERLGAAARRWQLVLSSDLPAQNVQLQQQGAPPLRVPAQARDSIEAM